MREWFERNRPGKSEAFAGKTCVMDSITLLLFSDDSCSIPEQRAVSQKTKQTLSKGLYLQPL
jgi:hypothetical protein